MPKPENNARKKKTATIQWRNRVYTRWRSSSPSYTWLSPIRSKALRALSSKRSTEVLIGPPGVRVTEAVGRCGEAQAGSGEVRRSHSGTAHRQVRVEKVFRAPASPAISIL